MAIISYPFPMKQHAIKNRYINGDTIYFTEINFHVLYKIFQFMFDYDGILY